MKRYSIVEIFCTIQGEGAFAGTAAVFVRLAGCNLWTGHDEHRERDAAAHGAECPRWCDTDFRKGQPMTSAEIAKAVEAAMKGARAPIDHIVVSGGEPLLQLDLELWSALRAGGSRVAIETNGTQTMPRELEVSDLWVTCSPKTAPDKLKIQRVNELKVVVPDYNPEIYRQMFTDYGHLRTNEEPHDITAPMMLFVQARARILPDSVGRSLIDAANSMIASQYVMGNPEWRLSTQVHKIVGLP